MLTASLILAAATFGVDPSWAPDGAGGKIYVIQIEPELLDAMRDGAVITSEIPPDLQGVRAYRIVVGRNSQNPIDQSPIDLPREDLVAVQPWESGLSTVLRPTGEAPAPAAPTNETLADDSTLGDSPLGEATAGEAEVAETPAPAPPDPLLEDPNGQPGETEAPAQETIAASSNQPSENPQSGALADNGQTDQLAMKPQTTPETTSAEVSTESQSEAADSRLPLLWVAIGLCLSIGINIFLFMVTFDTRRHYRALVRQTASLG